jgi:hypothetical protein
MSESTDILRRVRQSAARKMLFLPHAIRQMSNPDRMITLSSQRPGMESGYRKRKKQ